MGAAAQVSGGLAAPPCCFIQDKSKRSSQQFLALSPHPLSHHSLHASHHHSPHRHSLRPIFLDSVPMAWVPFLFYTQYSPFSESFLRVIHIPFCFQMIAILSLSHQRELQGSLYPAIIFSHSDFIVHNRWSNTTFSPHSLFSLSNKIASAPKSDHSFSFHFGYP